MSSKSYLIGIAGPSGSGKSHLARHLASVLGDAMVLSLDSYYHDLSHIPLDERVCRNFDDPQALDSELLIEHVRELVAGRPIVKPVYDFAAHTRIRRSEEVKPCAFILVEGLHVLYWPELRHLLQTKVYVDLAEEVCLARRIERDVRERARSSESVIEQYRATVAPMAAMYIRPTARLADVQVSGSELVADAVARILHHIRHVTKGHIPASPAGNP